MLVADAKLVFLGRVKSVTPSNIRTTLSYVPCDGVTFQWQIAEVEVVEPFKGLRKGDFVQVAMLSVDRHSQSQPIYSPPGMLEPKKDDLFLLCLGRTPRTNLFAALLAPYDENLSVFPLYRVQTNHVNNEDRMLRELLSGPLPPALRREGSAKQIEALESRNKQYDLIFGLVGASGDIQPTNVQEFRKTFATDIAKTPSTNLVYLEWKTYTNPHGWRSDVPKDFETTTNTNEK